MTSIPSSRIDTNTNGHPPPNEIARQMRDVGNQPTTPSSSLTFMVSDSDLIPPLPKDAKPNLDLAGNASPWLDRYIDHSRKWAPDAYDGYHEAVGLWVLSTVAARRVAFPLGGLRFTSLYLALLGRTSVYTKTTAAKVGTKVIGAAGLNYLLCPDEMTPAAFIEHLSNVTPPKNYSELAERDQEWHQNQIAFAGQKGWYHDEFGSKVTSMMKEGGYMAEYRGILRVMDDGRDEYRYTSIGRGNNTINQPYLSLLANMTPADLRPYAKRGALLWNDGFWARFGFVSPGESDVPKKGKWPNELHVVPAELTKPLIDWHKRLGVRSVVITDLEDGDGKSKGSVNAIVANNIEPSLLELPTAVYDAYYSYRFALIDLVTAGKTEDLDGNYSRLPEKAIRIAALLASFQGEREIKLCHWHRALEITERWRVNLHSLYRQLTGTVEVDRSRTIEDAIIEQIKRYGPRTARELKQFTNMSSDDVKSVLPGMVADGTLLEMKEGKAIRYVLHEV